MTIGVLGSGAFGTALAIALAAKGHVTLWTRDPEQADAMTRSRQNARRLPGIVLPGTLHITAQTSDLAGLETILIAVPMQTLRETVRHHSAWLNGKTLVACCKGVELATHEGPVKILTAEAPGSTSSLLTGPSFARDIAQGLPTALTLACEDADRAKTLQEALTTPTLRLYSTTDVRGAELGGALKNVMAIACGAVMGAGLGESARAALMTRGFAEMQRIAIHLGADPHTLAGLSGFGDLALTCTSAQSRNYQMGLSLGAGRSDRPDATVEGVATAQAVADLADQLEFDLPITRTVSALATGQIDIQTAVASLLARPLKEE